jgi:hypothetical protein
LYQFIDNLLQSQYICRIVARLIAILSGESLYVFRAQFQSALHVFHRAFLVTVQQLGTPAFVVGLGEVRVQLNGFIMLDREYLEKTLGVELDTFSFHNTTPFTQSCLEYRYGGLINVYSSYFKEHYNYCGDSLGYWRFDRLEEVLQDPEVQHLQVLTHDWADEPLSPRKRFSKAMRNHAERLIAGQVNGLHSKGMLCPDDDED